MRILVGSTGFVGSVLAQQAPFDLAVHRPDVDRIRGVSASELVCAGLPAIKYIANAQPAADWENARRLASALVEVNATEVVLISTMDVYQPPSGATEDTAPAYDGVQAYGRHRAWLETLVRAHFPCHTVIRLPGLFGPGLRKNLIFDLLEGREDQLFGVNGRSTFQFFDVTQTWSYVRQARTAGIDLLNIATEPLTAQAVADLFGVKLGTLGREVHYDVRTKHDRALDGNHGYIQSAADQLAAIENLRRQWPTPGLAR